MVQIAHRAVVSSAANVYGDSRIGWQVEIGAGVTISDSIIDGNSRIYGRVTISGGVHVSDTEIAGEDKAAPSGWGIHIEGPATIRSVLLRNSPFCIGADGEILADRHILSVGPIGMENRFVTVHRTHGGQHRAMAGCWNNGGGGTLEELEERVRETRSGINLDEYLAFIAMARIRTEEWLKEERAMHRFDGKKAHHTHMRPARSGNATSGDAF